MTDMSNATVTFREKRKINRMTRRELTHVVKIDAYRQNLSDSPLSGT